MEKRNIYFLGIGGIGMSALARYFYQKGCIVSGYDKTPSPLTKKLEEEGILVHYEDNPDLIPENVDLVILTPAIPTDSLELNYLRDIKANIMKRAEVLGEISRRCDSVAVAGSHGKTTVTAMITHLLNFAGKKMSAFVGGIAKNINSNVIIGDENDELVSEELTAENILKSPVERIVEIGTGNMRNNYKASKGDTVYIVATSVAVRLEPNENSEKICTLNKNDSAKILEINSA